MGLMSIDVVLRKSGYLIKLENVVAEGRYLGDFIEWFKSGI